MPNPWSVELWRVALATLGLLLVGLLLGRTALVLGLGALAYFGWHLWQLVRLERWLHHRKGLEPPTASGIWGEVFHHIHRLQQRNRKRKQKLAAILSRFQESTAAMPDATVVLNEHWQIEWSNEAAARVLGLRHAHDIGQRIDNLIRHPAFVEFIARGDFARVVEIPSPLDETMTLSLRVVPYGNEQRLLIVRDVSRLRQLEQMRRDFVANVSHELRTPLTVIAGFLETLSDSGDECARQWRRSLELMQQQASRMQHLVEDLLLLSRLESGTAPASREPVDVPALLAAVVEDARVLSGDRQHVFQLEADPQLWLLGSAEELRSAFSNLVFNAVKYTPPGGEIRLRWQADAQGARFTVRDTGVGIARQHIPRLTERFYRVDVARSRESGGTGLGLAIVKHVLSRHGGELGIESQLGRGSTFTCRFPAELIARPGAEQSA